MQDLTPQNARPDTSKRAERVSSQPSRPSAPALLALFAALIAAIATYAIFARQRHVRLRDACTMAFDAAYATTRPVPAFEMSYSYGEPVFQVAFGSKDAMQAAATANASFLAAIDVLCKDRGRKRQFKAQRAVFFQHPDEDKPVVTHCCDAMRANVGTVVAFDEATRRYGLRAATAGMSALPIAHCPWCGATLPPADDGRADS